MKIGLLKEIKQDEFRVALTPGAVEALVEAGHAVMVEQGAGLDAGIGDAEYEAVGARIVDSAEELWAEGEMIVKVKEPLEPEFEFMREGQILFAFLHLAACEPLARALVVSGSYGVAFETVTSPEGVCPSCSP